MAVPCGPILEGQRSDAGTYCSVSLPLRQTLTFNTHYNYVIILCLHAVCGDKL